MTSMEAFYREENDKERLIREQRDKIEQLEEELLNAKFLAGIYKKETEDLEKELNEANEDIALYLNTIHKTEKERDQYKIDSGYHYNKWMSVIEERDQYKKVLEEYKARVKYKIKEPKLPDDYYTNPIYNEEPDEEKEND